MYLLTIHYDDSVTDFMQDINTFAFATDLMLRGVYTEQPRDDQLLFNSEQDRTYAVISYTGNGTLECV